jgi:hypothetical protein
MFASTLAIVLAMSTPQVADLPLDTTGLEPAGSWPFAEGTTIVMDSARHLVCMAAGCGVLIIDVTDPSRPAVISDRIRCQSQVWDMWLDGTRLYLAMATWMLAPSVERDIEIWDISDATDPERLSSLDLDACTAVWARDSLMLVSSWGRFLSYNVSDPRNPVLLCSVGAPTIAYRIAVRDTFAFLSTGLRPVQVFDIANAGNLKWLAEWGNDNLREPGMAVEGDRLYQVAMPSQGSSCGMRIYDITDPLDGQLLGAFDTMPYASPYRLVVRDTIAAVAYRGAGLRLVSVADPAHPYEIAGVGDPCRDVVWCDTLAYTAGSSKLQVVNLADPSMPSIVASLVTRQAGSGVALAEGAILSLGCGLSVLGNDATGDLTLVGRLDTPEVTYSLSAFDTLAVASVEDGFVVFGVADPSRPSVLSRVRAGFPNSALWDTFCYVVADSEFKVYSLARPRDPALLGSVHGQFWWAPVVPVGDLVLVGADELSVFDVTDPGHPLWLMDTTWQASCVAARDTFAFTISDSLDSIRVYSIAGGLHVRGLGAVRVPYHTDPSQGSAAIAVSDTLLVAAVPTWLGIYSVAEPAQPRCLYQSRTPFPGCRALLLSHDTLYAALGNRGLFRYRLVTEPSGLELEPIGVVGVRPLRVWPSVVNREVNLADCKTAILMDASGRKVLDLKAGANDVRALAPGVYFIREGLGSRGEGLGKTRKVVVTR